MGILLHGNAEWLELENFFKEKFPTCLPEKDQVFDVLQTLYMWEQKSYNEYHNDNSELQVYKRRTHPKTKLDNLTAIDAIKRLDSISYTIQSPKIYPVSRMYINYLTETIANEFSIDMESDNFKEQYERSIG